MVYRYVSPYPWNPWRGLGQMPMLEHHSHFNEPIAGYMRADFPVFRQHMTIGEALLEARTRGLGDKVFYFYVTDDDDRLTGVIPIRRLLGSDPDTHLADVMIRRMVALPLSATVYDACELFLLHRFLALPVVDEDRRIVGIVDIGLFTDEIIDIAEREKVDDIFQWVGIRISQLSHATPLKAFRYRIPWLAATVGGGLLCAVVTAVFETTLAQALVLGVFYAMVLGLGESVAVQAVTIAIQSLHSAQHEKRFLRILGHEALTVLMMGLVLGGVTGFAAYVWRGHLWLSAGMAGSICMAIVAAGVIGTSVPVVLHRLRRDPKVAAGPIALALTDAATSLLYFGTAAAILATNP